MGTALDTVLVALSLLAALVAFGWVSRRFERQADSFAVQHLSGHHARSARVGKAETIVSPEACSAMAEALESVSRLNGMRPARRSWRHGSIRSRQAYLAGLEGQSAGRLAIDRHVRVIKLITILVLALSMALAWWMDRASRDAAGAGESSEAKHAAFI